MSTFEQILIYGLGGDKFRNFANWPPVTTMWRLVLSSKSEFELWFHNIKARSTNWHFWNYCSSFQFFWTSSAKLRIRHEQCSLNTLFNLSDQNFNKCYYLINLWVEFLPYKYLWKNKDLWWAQRQTFWTYCMCFFFGGTKSKQFGRILLKI